MQKIGLFAALVVGTLLIGVSGCGDNATNTVVEPSAQGGLPPEAQQSYEEAMKNRSGRESN